MPVDLEGHCKRILEDIESTSQSIRRSALAYANGPQNFEVSERLRRELETIRISADAILEAIAKASVTNYTIDERLIDWLFSGELRSCLGKLKEMDIMLKPVNPAQPVPGPARALMPGEDKLAAAMVFFDRNKSLFHFFITPDVWNRERLLYQSSGLEPRAPRTDALPVSEATEGRPQESQSSNVLNSTAAGYSAESNMDHTVSKTRHLKESHRRQLEEILRWLAALNCTDKHNFIYQLLQDGTCKWFPNTDVYEKWRTCGAQFLWLHGKAGCGKSVLVASTIEHLKTTLQYQEVVVFFYFDFQNERSRSPVEMMRSLLSQLCRHLLDLGVDPGNFLNMILKEKGKGTLSLNDLDRLRGLVSCAADCFVREPIVVIDALDECADVELLLRALVRLHDDDKVRLLMTSRPHHDMMHRFTIFPSLSFEDVAMELAADIELHVEREISHNQLKFAGAGMKKEIHMKLNTKAEGRFRWVQCQINILKRCTTAQELKEVLDNLPTELEATYERILDAIDERRSEGKLARRVLAWLMVALEPLRLVQILDMLSVDFPSQRNIIREGVELVDMLSSLVSHYKETDVVSLSHFSVKEFLTGRTTLPMYQIVLCEAHAEAVQSCMCYISAFIKQVPFRRNVATSESWPMLSYVFSSGFNHLAHLDPKSIVVLDALLSLGSDVRHHPSYWDRLCQLREEDLKLLYPPWPSSRHDFVLYILIAYASVGLLQTFLSGHRPIKARFGTNPLVYAADLRKTNHAIALLTCGSADVDVRSLAIDDSHYVSPLEVSIDRDEDLLVGELLKRGCLVTSELLTTAVCLPWCSARVLVKLVHTHEFEEWAHAIGDEKLYRGIFCSARPNAGDIRKADKDHVALARRLRQIGQDLSADSPFGAELIERALHAAHISMLEYLLPVGRPPPARFLLAASTGDTSETASIVCFLLGRGADTNVVTERGDTVLHLAAMCPWEPRSLELTEMFICAGCNPYVPNSMGETPLTIAANREYLSVVEHLLSSNIMPPSNSLPNALQQRFTPEIVQLLIRNGADVNSTLDGETVLHLAITKYKEPLCLELVRSFVEAGCNTAICNSKGETALHIAIKRRYTSVVQLLLLHDVPLPPDILPFALQRYTSPQLVGLLIRNEADVHSTTPEGETILHLAIAHYNESMCLELVTSFVEAGCDTAICNIEGETVLHTAVKRGCPSLVELLLSHNVPLPPSILSFALQQYVPPQLVQLLIHNGADVHFISSEGESVFHLAITNYDPFMCLELMKKFVDAGGNTTIRNSEGDTALHMAIKDRYGSVVELLLSHNVPLPPGILPFALQQYMPPQLVQLLIRNGADVHSTSSEGETVFHLAIANYDESMCLELVKKFVEAGGNPILYNSDGETALQITIKRGYASVVELLLSHNVPLPPNILPFALQRYTSPQLVGLLIRNGADVHSTTPGERETILHLAIAHYSESMCLELVASFIEAGCDTTICNIEGETVLHTAVKRGCPSLVELLLSHNVPLPPSILSFALQQYLPPQLVLLLIRNGADVHFISFEGESIFHLAITNYDPFTCLELMKKFVEAGGNTTICNSEGETALHIAIKDRYHSVVELLLSHNVPLPPGILPFALQQYLPPQLVQLLIRNGADVHSTSSEGETVFHLAIANYDEFTCLKLVKDFIEAGGNPTACSSEGTSALDSAIEHGFNFVLEFLLNGAVAHSTLSKEELELLLAVTRFSSESTCLRLAKGFVEAGCNTNTYSTGKTVYRAALKHPGYTSVVELLLSHNVPLPRCILPFALQHCASPRLIQFLMYNGADVYSTSPEGETIFHLAIAHYNESMCLELVTSFVEAGCDTAICNIEGETVLHTAVKRGCASLVELLLSHNVPLPRCILPFALQQYSPPRLVQFLIRNGADVDSTTPEGETIFHLAIANYYEFVCLGLVKKFIGAGSDPTLCNSDGKIALQIAIERGYASVVEILISIQ